jgi:hypothetical protein
MGFLRTFLHRARFVVLIFPLYGVFSSFVQGCAGKVNYYITADSGGGGDAETPPPPGCDEPYYGYGYGTGCDDSYYGYGSGDCTPCP